MRPYIYKSICPGNVCDCANCFDENPRVWGKHLTIQLLWATSRLLVTRVSPIYLVDDFMFSRCLFLMLLNEMRILGESNVLPFLFLVLIKGMRRWCEFRSSHRRCSAKKVVLKNFAVFTRKHLYWSLFLIKLQAFRPTTLLTWTPTQTFSCECCEIFKSTYFEKHLWTAASVNQRFSWVTLEVESFSARLLQAERCNLICEDDSGNSDCFSSIGSWCYSEWWV